MTSSPLPKAITVDHGTEFTSTALDAWAYRRGVTLDFIRPGKPVENALIESFTGRLSEMQLKHLCAAVRHLRPVTRLIH